VSGRTSTYDKQQLLDFGNNLKKLRLKKGFSQEYLAEEIGISQTQIGRIEVGLVNTSLSNILAIAEGLQIPPGKLFDY
jgi:transcriptional regulator with XRE-family HTH domain